MNINWYDLIVDECEYYWWEWVDSYCCLEYRGLGVYLDEIFVKYESCDFI